MAACDICRITYACTSEDKTGNLIVQNCDMLFMLSACKYKSHNHYAQHFSYFANNKRTRAWCELWNKGFEFK